MYMKKSFKKLFISNYTIDNYFGRFGNNLQQIALGIMYAKLYKKNFYLKNHELVHDFSIIHNQFSDIFNKYKHASRFYYFESSTQKPSKIQPLDEPLNENDKDYYKDNFYNIFQKYIYPNLKFRKEINIDKNTLVIHIRNGDIFEENYKNFYIQNPLIYYLELIEKFEKVIVVSSNQFNNPVMPILSKHPKVEIQSSTITDDFNVLLSANNLATSGVGTFPIAAALSSKKLNNLYYSNIFFNHHLNPLLVKNVKHFQYHFHNYLKIGTEWIGSKEQNETMLSKNIKMEKY